MRKSINFFILIAIIFLGWFFLKENKTDIHGSYFSKYNTEPEFIIEGKIFLLDESDTLSIIEVEIADNNHEISRGLMNRSKMEENQGMLFLFDKEEDKSFWMKNTIISLDIIFINSDNKIVHIAKHTVPYSTDPIPSIEPAIRVLEVNAGFCDENKIGPGHMVLYRRYPSKI